MQALQWEQEVTAGPGVRAEVARFPCPILTALCLHPLVHFAYFPAGKSLLFRNFADTRERITNAARSYNLAERPIWPHVVAAMRNYGVLARRVFPRSDGLRAAIEAADSVPCLPILCANDLFLSPEQRRVTPRAAMRQYNCSD